jgi:hypothetical protein
MSKNPPAYLCPARPSEVKILGRNLVDQLLAVESKLQGPDQFRAKKEIISHFEKHEPDLFSFFREKVISPYQFLIKVQRAFEKQSDVTFDGVVISKRDATEMLNRYIPNLQYLHDNQLYTNADSFKELGAAVAIGVVVTGLTEAVGRKLVSNPYLTMEMAIVETASVALFSFVYFVGSRNRNVFHKAPWNSAIYLGANLYETNPDNWESVTWKQLQQGANPFKGFTLLKTRPHYEALDKHVSRRDVNASV